MSELRARQLLQEAIADQAATAAKSADDLDAQASAQHRLNDAVSAGSLSSEEARRQMTVEQALRPLIVAETLAEGDARETLTRVVEALRGAYARLNTEEARAAALQTIEGQREQIALLQKQIDLAGQGESRGRLSSPSSRRNRTSASAGSLSPAPKARRSSSTPARSSGSTSSWHSANRRLRNWKSWPTPCSATSPK